MVHTLHLPYNDIHLPLSSLSNPLRPAQTHTNESPVTLGCVHTCCIRYENQRRTIHIHNMLSNTIEQWNTLRCASHTQLTPKLKTSCESQLLVFNTPPTSTVISRRSAVREAIDLAVNKAEREKRCRFSFTPSTPKTTPMTGGTRQGDCLVGLMMSPSQLHP